MNQFTMQWKGGPEGPLDSLGSMLMANADDEALCNWLRNARLNEQAVFGGGAAPACTVRRVA